MAEIRTIARPYAQAAFQLAREHDALARWSGMLRVGAVIAADPALRDLIGNPRVSRQQLTDLVLGVAGERLDEHGANFIRLLVENDRLRCLPEIAALYETYRREAEQTVEAHVVTAFALSEEQQRQISAALQTRLGRTVTLTQSVDESLLGGMTIRTDDHVIDGSVTSQLDKLARALAG